MENNIELTKEIIDGLIKDQEVRRSVVKKSHYTFFHLYFNQYVMYQTAPFQKEMF